MNYNHNDFIFKVEENELRLLRDFDGMYTHCEDPHGQSKLMDNLSYQLIITAVERVAGILSADSTESLSIMDIGCGLGYFTARLKQKFPAAFVRGMDISRAALERASKIASGCSFLQADIRTFDSAELGDTFDIVIALDCLYYFAEDEIDQVLTNIASLLVEGGFLVVGYHLPDKMRFGRYIRSLSDANSLFQSHGMAIVYSFDVQNSLDQTYAGSPVGRHLYFLARKWAADSDQDELRDLKEINLPNGA